jgi:hypothetical protein
VRHPHEEFSLLRSGAGMLYFKCLRFYLASFLVLHASESNAFSQAASPGSYHLLSFDKKGALEKVSGQDLQKIRESLERNEPTDVFLMSHGWNNTEITARNTYSKMVELMREQSKRIQPPLENFTPLVVGVSWPSQFASDEELNQAAPLVSQLLDSLGVKKDKLQASIKKTLANPWKRMVIEKLIDPEDLAEFIKNPLSDERIEDVFRDASYYAMKKRAGLVGGAGVRQALGYLQAAFPSARFHLVGHSFGCKVWLECLRQVDLPKPVDTLVLLQGAVSNQCFAQSLRELNGGPGAYAEIPKQVNGPIVITFTEHDHALRLAFPAASQLTGQFAETPAKTYKLDFQLYAALGAKGVDGVLPILMKETGQAYAFRKGLNTVNAARFIKSHNDIGKPEVAWMIWGAVLRR